MLPHNNLCPECFADTLLAEMVGFWRPNHKNGIGEVFNEMRQNRWKSQVFLGIIDDDSRKPGDFKFFEIQKSSDGLVHFRHKTNHNHHLIVVSPAFERWVFDNAEAKGIDPARFKFDSIKKFGKAAKDKNVASNRDVKDFLNTLKQKNAPGLVTLKAWILEILPEN